MPKKIALLGSAPSSIRLAPHDDASWLLWGCSPGCATAIAGKRVDVWFELHRVTEDFPWFKKSDPYWKFLTEFKGPVWMIEPHPEIPNSQSYPIEKMLDKYGPFFWQSSLSYMAALALEEEDLGVLGWRGVDMAATEEYERQKPACQFFIWEAMKRGIFIDIPPESDLFYPQQMYGYSEHNPHRIKLDVRKAELAQRLTAAAANKEAAHNEWMFIKGAFDDNTYHANTYVQHPYAVGVLGRMKEQNAARGSSTGVERPAGEGEGSGNPGGGEGERPV
jgi:hypothetical protein